MLRFIRQGQRWIVTAMVVAIGAVFILFFGPWDFSQTGGSEDVPVVVDGEQFDRQDVLRVRQQLEQRYREAMGDQFDAAAASLQLQDQAVRQIVDRAILAAEARRLGLAASDKEVDQLIRQTFSDFRDEDGRLSEERARNYVVYEWGSVRRFKEEVRNDIVLRKLGRLLLASAGASEAEARDSLRYRLQEVRIAFVKLDPASPPGGLEVIEGDVEEFARAQAERIAAYYEENRARFELPARIRLRHVLVAVGEDGEDAAREQAEAARARIEAGEDMAEVARELSDDAGSRELGGDLGLLAETDVSRALRDAVADLELRALSPVVRGEQGFHVVRVEERRPAETRTLEDVSNEIALELYRKDQAAEWVTHTADELEAAIAEGRSLEDAARDLHLNIERTAFFRHRPDGFVPELGDSLEVQAAAFALGPDEPTWPRPFVVNGSTVFIQLLERRDPDPGALEAAVEEERERLQETAQRKAEIAWLAERRSQLQAEGKIFIDPSALEN